MAEIKFSSVTALYSILWLQQEVNREISDIHLTNIGRHHCNKGSNCLSSIWEVIMVILEIEYEGNIEKVLFFISHSLTFHDQNPELNYKLMSLCNVISLLNQNKKYYETLLCYQHLFLIGMTVLPFFFPFWSSVGSADSIPVICLDFLFLLTQLLPSRIFFLKFWNCLSYCPTKSTPVTLAGLRVRSSTFPMKESFPLSYQFT